ncbi:MAG: DUF2157 domain-containing protein, partial [Rubrivivax sp.]|nr:DUF2157 domain-containing protein [Rubrivivax sp.]
RHTSAGEWALRTALSLAVVMISSSALGGLFQSSVAGHYGLGLLVLAVLAALLSRPAGFDIFGLSAVALGLNALLFGGLARLLFDNSGDDPIGRLLLLGVAAAAMLGGTVALILRLSRERAAAAVEGGAS